MSIVWEPGRFAPVPADLGLRQALSWQTDPPRGWTKARAFRTHEETLETIMALHLADICAENIRLIGIAGDYWGGADIIGLDALGRVHLFELKLGSINLAAARQLSYYLLQYVFVEPSTYLAPRWERTGEWELKVERLAEAMAGALAGQRTNNIGWRFAKEWGVDPGVTEAQWRRLDYAAKHPTRLAALLAKASTIYRDVPTPDEVIAAARQWREKLWPSATLPEGAFVCQRPVVIWLVGASFTAEAEEEIRNWRAAGVDARCLQAEVRHSANGDGLILGVAREDAPDRTLLFRRLEEWAENHRDVISKPGLELRIHTEARASSRHLVKEEAGRLRDQVLAIIQLPNGNIEELSVP